jgi:hypothetical protein
MELTCNTFFLLYSSSGSPLYFCLAKIKQRMPAYQKEKIFSHTLDPETGEHLIFAFQK